MNKLEKEIKKVEDNSDITKWQAVWGITKALGEIGLYVGLMGLGYYIGDKIGGETIGQFGAIAVGFGIIYGQDSCGCDDGHMEI